VLAIPLGLALPLPSLAMLLGSAGAHLYLLEPFGLVVPTFVGASLLVTSSALLAEYVGLTARGATLEGIVGEPYLAVTGIFLAVVWEAIGHLYSAGGDGVRARCSESLASFSAAIGYAGSLAVLPRAANL